MFTTTNVNTVQHCIDDYLTKNGKEEINEMEANRELARAGVMADDRRNPGHPLRELFRKLRDANSLPANIRQLYGSWKIKHSRSTMKMAQIFQF